MAGYSVAHPPQWSARWESGVITVSQNNTGAAQAMFWPIQLRVPLHARQVAEKFVTRARAQKTKFQAWLMPTSEPFPRQVIMRTCSEVARQRVGGVLAVTVEGSNAMISGFHAPADSTGASDGSREAQTLVNIVRSFQGELPIARRVFREPREDSFGALVPEGWQATGRVRRSMSRLIGCEYTVRKDTAGMTHVAVPGEVWRLADGPIMGLCYLGLMGMKHFQTAGKFGPDLVSRQFKRQSHLRIVEVTDCPQILPRFGLSAQSAETSVACVVSEHLVGATRIRQKSFVATARPVSAVRWSSAFSGQWIAELLAYYQAPESELDQVEPILAGVADSFQINNDWVQRVRLADMQAAMILGAMMQMQAQQQLQDREIQNGGKLTVRESQLALFVNEGRVADAFGPGLYTLNTHTLPILTYIMNWDKAFQSPFKSDVYFFSTRFQIDRHWGTQNPITFRDKEFGAIRLRGFGIYSFHVNDAKVFYTKISRTRDLYRVADLEGQLRNTILAKMTDTFAASQLPFLDMAANHKELSPRKSKSRWRQRWDATLDIR